MAYDILESMAASQAAEKSDSLVNQSGYNILDFYQPPEPVKPKTPETWMGEATAGFGRGVDEIQQMLYGAGALGSSWLGAENAKEWFLKGYNLNEKEIAANPATVGTYEDVSNFDSAIRYGLSAASEIAPQLGVMLGTSVVGEGLGVLGAMTDIGETIGQGAVKKMLLNRGIRGEVRDEIKGYLAGTVEKAALSERAATLVDGATVARAKTIGSLGAQALSSIQMETGSIYGDMINNPDIPESDKRLAATVGGIIAAIPDTFVSHWVAGKILGKSAEKLTTEEMGSANGYFVRFMTKAAKEMAKVIPAEAGQEFIQTGVELAAQNWADPATRYDFLNYTPEQWTSMIDAGIRGGIGGILPGVLTGALHPDPKVRSVEREVTQKADDVALNPADVTADHVALSKVQEQILAGGETEALKAQEQELLGKVGQPSTLVNQNTSVSEPPTEAKPTIQGSTADQELTRSLEASYSEIMPTRKVSPEAFSTVKPSEAQFKSKENELHIERQHGDSDTGVELRDILTNPRITAAMADNDIELKSDETGKLKYGAKIEGDGIKLYIPDVAASEKEISALQTSMGLNEEQARKVYNDGVRQAVEHEMIHALDLANIKGDWKSSGSTDTLAQFADNTHKERGRILREADPLLPKVFKAAYHYGDVGSLSDIQLGQELPRMAVEMARNGKTTEATEALAIAAQKNGKLNMFLRTWIDALKKAAGYVKKLLGSNPELKKVYDNINAALDKYGLINDGKAQTDSLVNQNSNEIETKLSLSNPSGPSEDATASAISHLETSGEAGGLKQWAQDNGRLITQLPYELNSEHDKGQAEHHVFFDNGRWIKITKGEAGVGVENTPSEYLKSIQERNRVFHDDIKLHGIYEDDKGSHIVTSQPHYQQGDQFEGDLIAENKIRSAMSNDGFRSYGNNYYRRSDNLLVLDLHHQNAVMSGEAVFPFDVTLVHPTAEQRLGLGIDAPALTDAENQELETASPQRKQELLRKQFLNQEAARVTAAEKLRQEALVNQNNENENQTQSQPAEKASIGEEDAPGHTGDVHGTNERGSTRFNHPSISTVAEKVASAKPGVKLQTLKEKIDPRMLPHVENLQSNLAQADAEALQRLTTTPEPIRGSDVAAEVKEYKTAIFIGEHPNEWSRELAEQRGLTMFFKGEDLPEDHFIIDTSGELTPHLQDEPDFNADASVKYPVAVTDKLIEAQVTDGIPETHALTSLGHETINLKAVADLDEILGENNWILKNFSNKAMQGNDVYYADAVKELLSRNPNAWATSDTTQMMGQQLHDLYDQSSRLRSNKILEKQELRVHVLTDKDGNASVIPSTTFWKLPRGQTATVPFEQRTPLLETEEIRAAHDRALKSIRSLPVEDRSGQMFGMDIIRLVDGWGTVENNPTEPGGHSGYFVDSPLAQDSYMAALLGERPVHQELADLVHEAMVGDAVLVNQSTPAEAASMSDVLNSKERRQWAETASRFLGENIKPSDIPAPQDRNLRSSDFPEGVRDLAVIAETSRRLQQERDVAGNDNLDTLLTPLDTSGPFDLDSSFRNSLRDDAQKRNEAIARIRLRTNGIYTDSEIIEEASRLPTWADIEAADRWITVMSRGSSTPAEAAQWSDRAQRELDREIKDVNQQFEKQHEDLKRARVRTEQRGAQGTYQNFTQQASEYKSQPQTDAMRKAQSIISENGLMDVIQTLQRDPLGSKYNMSEYDEALGVPNATLTALYDNASKQLDALLGKLKDSMGDRKVRMYIADSAKALRDNIQQYILPIGRAASISGKFEQVMNAAAARRSLVEPLLNYLDKVLGKNKGARFIGMMTNELNKLMSDHAARVVTTPKVIAQLEKIIKLMHTKEGKDAARRTAVMTESKARRFVKSMAARMADHQANDPNSPEFLDMAAKRMIKMFDGIPMGNEKKTEVQLFMNAVNQVVRENADALGLRGENQTEKVSDADKLAAILKNDDIYHRFVETIHSQAQAEYKPESGSPFAQQLAELRQNLHDKAWSQGMVDALVNQNLREYETTFAKLAREHYDKSNARVEDFKESVRQAMRERGVENEPLLAQLVDDAEGAMRSHLEDARLQFLGGGTGIREFLKHAQASLADLAKDHPLSKNDIPERLSDWLQDYYGIPNTTEFPLADELHDVVTKGYNDMLADKRKEIVQRYIDSASATKPEAKAKLHSSIAKIVELTNLGVMRDEETYNKLAEKFGLPKFDPVVAKDVEALGAAIATAPNNRIKNDALQTLSMLIASQKGIRPYDMFLTGLYVNFLTGVSTHVVNTGSNTASFAGLVGVLATQDVVENKGRHIPNILRAMWRTMTGSALYEMRETFFTGRSLHSSGDKFFPSHNVLEMQSPQFISNLQSPKARELAEKVAKVDYNIYNKLGGKWVGRALNAMDVFFYKLSQEAAFAAKGGQVETEAMRSSALMEADRQMRSIGLDPNASKANRRKRDVIANTLVNQMRTQSDADNLAFEEAHHEALDATFRQDPKGLLGKAAKYIEEWTKGTEESPNPLGKLLIPFTRIAANVTNQMLEWTPYGLLRYGAGHLYGEDFRLRDENDKPTGRDPKIAYRAVMGTLGAIALMGLFGQHAKDEDDPFFAIYDDGSKNPEKRRQMMDRGWRPKTIKIGRGYYSYTGTPFSMVFSIMGRAFDDFRDGKTKSQYDVGLSSSAVAMLQAVTHESFLSGLTDFMSAVDSPNPEDKLSRLMARSATSPFIPNLAKQLDKWWSPTVQQAQGFKETVMREMPIVRQLLKPSLNTFGEPIKREPGITILPGLDRFLTMEKTDDPVLNFGSEKDVTFPGFSKSTKLGNEVMTAEQYYDYVQQAGPKIKQAIAAELPQLKAMDKEQAQKRVETIARKIKEQVRSEMRSHLVN